MFSFKRRVATRIGIVGATIGHRPLFEIAAEQAAVDTGASVHVIWLAGVHSHDVDARIVLAGSFAVTGRCDVEATIQLVGRAGVDIPAIRNAFIEVIHRLT